MKNIFITLLLTGWSCCFAPALLAQNANCADGTVTGNETYSGAVFFNYGSVTNAFNTKNRITMSVGEPLLGPYFGQQFNGVMGFYSRFLLPPTPPTVTATEGDLNDRIQVNWVVDPLSPSAELGFNIYRDGAFIDHVEKEIRVYIDFNVQAGQFYHYEVTGVNSFGEGVRGSGLGFLNPNGVITGQIRTFSGNPVLGAGVTLTPTLGNALRFTGDDVAFTEFDSALIAPKWSVSCWVKIGAGNNNASILDFGSTVQKNWWLSTNGTSKGVKFSVGNGSSSQTATANFSADPDGWHHVAATYSGASLLLYLDGNLIATLTPAPILNDTLPLFFGRKPAGVMTNYFTGWLDDVRIFRRQLSQTEINQYKNRTVNSDADSLAAYWKFDEGTGSKGYDISEKRLQAYLCGPEWSDDRPDVVNGAVTDASGFYKIEGINYGAGTTFTATPSKTAYDNYALEFNGVNSQYALLTDSVLPGAQNAAIELRLQSFENTAATRTVLANEAGAGSPQFFRFNLSSGNISVNLGGTSNTFGALGTGYQHVVVNLKKIAPGTTAVSVYKNGALVSTVNYPVAFPNFGPQTWQLGARKTAGGYDQFFSGLIDEVAFYDTTLTLAQIQLNNAKGADATNAHLRSWFPLNENQGAALEDIGPARTGFGSIEGALWSTVTGISAATGHEFQPDKRLVTLNPSNTSTDLVDFTDLSTVSVSGYVRFDGTDCFARDVEILVDGVSASPKIMTDSTGKFTADFEPGRSAVLTPKLGEHLFSPASWQVRNLNAPVAGILFRDLTKRTLRGAVTGGLCKTGLIGPGQGIVVKVATPGTNPCFERTFTLNGNSDGGDKTYVFNDLPPRELNVSILSSNPTTFYNYFQIKGGETVDLRDASDTVDFNYVAPPQIEVVDGLDTNACGDPMIRQLERYALKFRVYQPYAGGNCYLDDANFTFNNDLADALPFDTVMTEGSLRYSFRGGEPNLASPYLKTLTVTAMQADSQIAVLPMPAVVLGQKSTGTTFATTMPQIPFMILRDPPGDASSAAVAQGKTTCNSVTMSATDGFNASRGYEVSLGTEKEILTGVGVAVATKLEIEKTTTYTISGSLSETRENSMEFCITADEVIATNGADNLIGRDADIFVGGALNFDFGVTNILKFDTCGYHIEKGIIAAPTGLATTYVFQRYDIVNQVIPNLLLSGLPGAAADIARWNQILALDDSLQNAAVFAENISFTGGVTYEKSLTTERSESYTHTADVEINGSIANEMGLMADGSGTKYMLEVGLDFSGSTSTSTSEGSASTVGYVLSDDDIGDLFSVTVKRDKRYGTPVFTLVSGETSCPWEAPTQKRNFVRLTSNTTAVANVNSNAAAVFVLTLGNQSETDEEQTYTLSIGDNPLGAIVKAEGQQLTAAGLEYAIPPGESVPVTLTVERGNLSYSYQDIGVVLAATCEDGSIEGFSQTLLLDVEFVEPCSEVDIAFPMQNDVINQATANPYQVTLENYDINDPDLELIRIQYRPKFGDGTWINIQPESDVPKASLSPVSTTVPWNVGTLNDGPYELRALTQCFGGNQAPGISTVINLRVERQPPALLGLPQPADGVLSPGDEISITFNEEINCDVLIQADIFNNNNVGLYDTETGDLIDATISCFENKIVLVPNIQNAFLEGKIMRVQVDDIEDLVGNKFIHAAWEFYVNRSPLDLEGGDLDVTMYEGEEKIVLRNLGNVSGSIAAFEIAGTPDWASIYPNIGSLLPGEEVVITYKFPNTLPQGEYLDTIYFANSQGSERVIIHLRVLCPAPGWTFDAAAYPHSMNLTAKLNIEGDLSEDEADQVAAFIDGQLRGAAHVQYLPALDAYMAFMTIYGEAADQNKPVHLEIWDASACLRFGEVVEQYTFQVDNVAGTLGNPGILHTNSQVRRDIPLTTGWNWISFNLGLPNPNLDPALASLQHPENDLIKAQSGFAEYFGGNWLGSLTAVNNTGMFQFRADVPDTIRMTGALIDPTSVNIPVATGWNWIGYVPNYALPVSAALGSLNPLNGDIIKGQTAFAQYLAGFGWLGSLQFLEPPKGYQLKISNPGTLIYPENNLIGAPILVRGGQKPPAANFWTVDPTQFEYSMTLVGMVANGGQNATLDSYELGVFAGNEPRGSTQAYYVEPLDAYLFFLTAYANASGELLHFQLFDAATGQVSPLAETRYFAANLHQGSIQEPVPFQLQTTGLPEPAADLFLELQPNPFSGSTTIRFKPERAQEARLMVTDVTGRLVWQQKMATSPGLNALRWDAGAIPPGVYFIRLETAGGSAVRKAVRK